MAGYNERLEELRQQIARKNRLHFIIKDLKEQRQELSDKVYELEKEKDKEQSDVDKLEGRSLATFYYNVVGKKDAMLDKERREAYAARVKYDAALSELTAVEADLERSEGEERRLQRAEQQYQQILQEKLQAIKEVGNVDADEVIRLEERLTYLSNQKKELDEAISAGQCACGITDKVLSSLDSAEGWGTWDLIGGGLITDIAKHSHLDEAQSQVEELQVQLRRFKTELADVQIQADMQVSVDGFLRFADYFFDGLFSAWSVLDKIGDSKSQVEETKSQINSVLSKLKGMLSAITQEQNATKAELDRLVLQVEL